MAWSLATSRLQLDFDAQGRIAGLHHQGLGTALWQGPPASPWRLVFRTEDNLECMVDATGQQALAEVSADAAIFDYPALVWNGVGLAIHVTYRATVADDLIQWHIQLHNKSSWTITEVWFPWLQHLGPLSGDGSEDGLLWPQGCGRRVTGPLQALARPHGWWGYNSHERQLRLWYPGQAAMQWYALSAESGGVYFSVAEDGSFTSTCLNVTGNPDPTPSLSCSIVKYPFLAPKGRWESPAYHVALYEGPWTEAARRYRAASTWWAAPRVPPWVLTWPGWLLIILKRQTGEIFWRYADLPELHRDAAAGGIDTVFVFGWHQGGHDHRYPEYDCDPAMGGEQGLVDAIAAVQQAGGRVVLYTQGRIMDRTTPFYQQIGRRIAAKTYWGDDYEEHIPPWGAATLHDKRSGNELHFSVACAATPEWQQQLEDQTRLVLDMGADGILYDQEGGAFHFLCYDANHPHASPAQAWGKPRLDTFKAIRARAKQRDAETVLVGENLSDMMTQVFDIIHGGGFAFVPSPEAFPDLFRFAFPEVVMTNRIIAEEDFYSAGYAWVHGFRFDVEIDGATGSMRRSPGLTRFLQRLRELRDRYAPWLLYGKYLSPTPRGLEGLDAVYPVTVEGTGAVVRGFASTAAEAAELAVCLWNDGQADVSVQIDRDPRERHGAVHVVGSHPDADRVVAPVGDTLRWTLPPLAVSVVMVSASPTSATRIQVASNP